MPNTVANRKVICDVLMERAATDRDIVVRACAEGRDLASTRAGELAQGIVSTIGPDEPAETIVDLMGTQQVKRMPVVENGALVTTKEDSESHGYGMRSIKGVAEKYGGTAEFFVRDHVFYLVVALPTAQLRPGVAGA